MYDVCKGLKKTGERSVDITNAVKPVCDAFEVSFEYAKLDGHYEVIVLDGEEISIWGTSVEHVLMQATAWILEHCADFPHNIGFFRLSEFMEDYK